MKWPAQTVEIAIEEWRPIPGLDHYEASNLGRVRSLDRKLDIIGRWGPMRRFHKGRILRLRPKPTGWGAIYAAFYVDGGQYWQANRAVCSAFHGPIPSRKHEAAHLDGDTLNDRPENLIWARPVENAAHKIGHGTAPIGSKNGTAILDENSILLILSRYSDGDNAISLGARFGVGAGTIRGIVGGRDWRHVPSPDRIAAKKRCAENIAIAQRKNLWPSISER